VTHVWFCGGGTGGHLYPGLAVARALARARPDVTAHFIGARRGVEREVLPSTEFAHTLLDLHPLYRQRAWRNWQTVRGLVTAWGGVTALARRLPPALVVGTGGYASGVGLAWAARHRVRIVQHIGDAVPGQAARWFAGRCVECYLGFPEAEARLPVGPRYLATGNPIEPPPTPRPDPAAARARWGFPPDAPVVLVTGGSQGARAINDAVAAWVRAGIGPLRLLWVTGRGEYDARRALATDAVRVIAYQAPMADAYAAADLAIARSGMMTVAELCAWDLPSVLVPLPTAAADHQARNADALAAAGAAVHLPQAALTADRLAAEVSAVLGDPARRAGMRAACAARARPAAAREIAARIAALV
jgi:UDP-N-acetylglucosamine--N-acetylmuramyl-(pentapeptide) pyrophosphoryl-undecaprenol N-acetylglucosamine transferase